MVYLWQQCLKHRIRTYFFKLSFQHSCAFTIAADNGKKKKIQVLDQDAKREEEQIKLILSLVHWQG